MNKNTVPRFAAHRLPYALVVTGLTVAMAALSSGVADAVPSSKARNLAAEVCENMVRDSAVAAAREQLAAPQTGTWRGRRYTCNYSFGDGALLVSVDVARNAATAKAQFAAAKRSVPVRTALNGIGQQGFQAATGILVARKDNFVLTVDPTALPGRLNRDSVAWSATRAIFDCW